MKERYGTVYKGSQRLIDVESGEVIEVDKLYRKQTSGNFVKALYSAINKYVRYDWRKKT
ncbi:replication and maintenance protein [Staphylococcus aureus]|nr:replication and maintenance protein [Staphylococcus aureus]